MILWNSPLSAIFRNPFLLLNSIRTIFKKDLFRNPQLYPHFNQHHCFIAPFYWTRALAISKFGRRGYCSFLGTGNHDLSQYFHYTYLSLYCYWKYGIFTLVTGATIWWCSLSLWHFHQTDLMWVVVVQVLSLVSSTFYRHLFECQNYNILGWMFLPCIFMG